MRKIKTILICSFCLIIAGLSHANETVRDIIPNAEKVGQGRLSYLLWDIYDASLYAPEGTWQKGKPFALKLSYLMEIDGKKIADRSATEIRDQGKVNEVQLATWHAQMRKIFPKVNAGETIIGIYNENKETIFFKNQEKLGSIKDPEFSEAFFAIWLDEQTSSPDLREKLLAGN